jgi:hypothetical protein
MADTQDNPFASVLGANVLTPPSDIAGALQGLVSPDDARMQQLRGGLAAGLTAAANNWNKPALAAFAGGAGGALQGINQAAQQQSDNRLKAVQAALQAWQAGDIPGLRRAQTDYYRALAQRMAGPQGPAPQPPPSPASAPNAALQPGNPTGGALAFGQGKAAAAPVGPQTGLSPSTAGSSLMAGLPAIPAGVPSGAAFSPSRNQWRSSDGRLFDMGGSEVPLSGAGTSQPPEMA